MEMADARLYSHWGSLTEALRSGNQQNEGKGGGRRSRNCMPTRSVFRLFLGAMTGASFKSAQAVGAQFPWRDYQTFVDVGCAQGCLPVQVALAQPHSAWHWIRFTGWARYSKNMWPVSDCQHRLRFQAGSFFDDPLPKTDVIVMGHILHDWDLPTKHMLLRKARPGVAAPRVAEKSESRFRNRCAAVVHVDRHRTGARCQYYVDCWYELETC